MDQKITLINYEGHLGYIKAVLEPVDDNYELIDEMEIEELIEEPEDLIKHNMSCHMRIIFDSLIIFNLQDFLNKEISL